MLEFYPCIVSRKLPVDTFLSFIPVSMPFFQFRVQVVNVLNPAFAETLFRQRGQLNLGYVKPTPMFRRMVELESLGKPQGLVRRKCLVEGTLVMGVQIIAHHNDLLRVRINLIRQPFHLVGPVSLGPVFQCPCMAVTGKRFREKEYAAGSITDIFAISLPSACDGFTTRCRKVRASPRRVYYTV